jgi:hypothetical protein
MRTLKFLVESIALAGFCLIALWVEYKVVLQFGGLALSIGAFSLFALLTALWRAPEGYENAGGFHVRTRPGRTERVRPGRGQPIRALKIHMARL